MINPLFVGSLQPKYFDRKHAAFYDQVLIYSLTTHSMDFLNIKDAATTYGKAEITIRRLVRSIVHDKDSADRSHIQPSVADVNALQKKKKPFSYLISTELLERMYSAPSAKASKSSTVDGGFVTLLQKTNDQLQDQLKMKDDQIRALNQALDGLSERQRETNILMKGLQEQFLLKAAKAKTADVLEAKAKVSVGAKKTPAAKPEEERKGWWRW